LACVTNAITIACISSVVTVSNHCSSEFRNLASIGITPAIFIALAEFAIGRKNGCSLFLIKVESR